MQTMRRSAFNLAAINKLRSRLVATNCVISSQEESTHLKSLKEIPSPSSLPFIGHLLHFLPGGILHSTTETVFDLLLKNFGPIVRLESMFGSPPLIFLFNAEAIGLILRNENWMPIRIGFESLDYYRRKNQKTENSPLGLLTDQNESWKQFRSTVNPIMLQPKTIKQYTGVLEDVSDDMIERMRRKRNEKFMIEGNFDYEMNLWALESISVVALGCRLNCLTRELQDDSPEIKLIQTIHEIFKLLDQLEAKPSFWRYISTPSFRKAIKCYDTQIELSKYFIRKGVQQMEKENKNGILHSTTETVFDLLLKNFGPIVRLESMFGSPPLIFLFNAEAIGLILRSENWMPIRIGFESLDYYRRKNQKTENSPLGLLTDQNESWKQFRSTVNPIMLQPKTIKQYTGVLEDVSDDMIERMRRKRNEKFMIEGNFDYEMNLWALESISVVALGCRLNCLTRELQDDSPEIKLIQTIHEIFKLLDQLEAKPSFWRYISTPSFRKAIKCYDTQIELSKYFIRKGVQQMEKENKNGEKSVLQKLLEINEDVAVVMATDMMFAGIDTAANTMTATLYLLAVNQDKQDELREEILSDRGNKTYLKACLKESMRRMPVASGNMRVTTKEYSIMGYKIPKDTKLAFGHQCLSLMEEQFSRPKEYIPERWIADKTDPLYYGNADPFAYSPFGFGARMCIGRRIAELETETFLSKLIENFKVEWFGPPIKTHSSILNYATPPFNFVFKDIK